MFSIHTVILEDGVIKMERFYFFLLPSRSTLKSLRTILGWETHFSDQQ